jgi:hypothetical protein
MASANPLESSLAAAADNPARRPDFYQTLLESQVFVIGHTKQGPAAGEYVAQPGEKMSLANWQKADGTIFIPFFGSMESLQRALKTPAGYVQLPARALFEMTRGSTLILNPGLPYGKEFFPAEIQALLSTGVNKQTETRVVAEHTRVRLGQPANYPTAMVEALSSCRASRASLRPISV